MLPEWKSNNHMGEGDISKQKANVNDSPPRMAFFGCMYIQRGFPIQNMSGKKPPKMLNQQPVSGFNIMASIR